eukprot:5793392-Pyramimonas_sp.AAC.1
MIDAAPGPGGIPFSRYHYGGDGAMCLGGEELPADFNYCYMVFLPKSILHIEAMDIARAPAATRPLSLSGASNKVISHAIDSGLAFQAHYA